MGKTITMPAEKKVTYDALILQAVAALKERGGSSVPAITKWVKANKKDANDTLIRVAVKRLSKGGKLDRVKASFKLSEAAKAAAKAALKPNKKAPAKKPAAKKAPAKKPAAKKASAKKAAAK